MPPFATEPESSASFPSSRCYSPPHSDIGYRPNVADRTEPSPVIQCIASHQYVENTSVLIGRTVSVVPSSDRRGGTSYFLV